MTQKDRLSAFRLRLKGLSYEQIGRQLGYDSHTVYLDLRNCLRGNWKPLKWKIRYPAICEYTEEECGGSMKALADRCGLSPNTLYNIFYSDQPPGPKVTQALERVIGKPRAELFREEDTP